MKDNTLLKQMLSLSQEELESMSITRQGTVTVKVKDEHKLPELEIKGADVVVGEGRVMVTKKATPRPYSGNTSRIVHQSQSSFGTTRVRVTKDNAVLVSFVGTTKSVTDNADIISALELAADLLSQDDHELNTQEVSNEMMLQYSRAKQLYDREEKMKVKSWETRERNDLRKLNY